jgi:hypothetical protein
MSFWFHKDVCFLAGMVCLQCSRKPLSNRSKSVQDPSRDQNENKKINFGFDLFVSVNDRRCGALD